MLMVVVSHFAGQRFRHIFVGSNITFVLPAFAQMGFLGVKIFLVISGYIITKLLAAEDAAQGTVNALYFYARRIFRIIPAYLFYVACVFAAGYAGWIMPLRGQGACIVFLANTAFAECAWSFIHFWTLAVEEQFYIVWPLFFLFVPRAWRAHCIFLAFFAFALSSVFHAPMPKTWQGTSWAFCFILMGAAYAESYYMRRVVRGAGVAGFLVSLAYIVITLPIRPASVGSWDNAVYDLIMPFTVLCVIAATYNARRFIRLGIFRITAHIGVASYGIYLWQQIVADFSRAYPAGSPLLMPLVVIPFIVFSYYAIERPAIAWARKKYKAVGDGHR